MRVVRDHRAPFKETPKGRGILGKVTWPHFPSFHLKTFQSQYGGSES